jgi:hypothetical protein
MEFFARSVGEKYECRLLSDDQQTIWHLRVPENTVKNWHIALKKWVEAKPDKFSMLISSSVDDISGLWDEISSANYAENQALDIGLTFLKVMAALARTLRIPDIEKASQNLLSKIQNLLVSNSKLNLRIVLVEKEKYEYDFLIDDSRTLPRLFKLDEEMGIPVDAWSLWLISNYETRFKREEANRAYDQAQVEIIGKILTNLDFLNEVMHISRDDANTVFRLNSWTNFLKAATKFLEETQDIYFIPFRRHRLAELFALIVQDELVDLEEQNLYLGRIFSQRTLNPIDQYELLVEQILPDLRDDALRNAQFTPRLVAVVSAISQYYLRQYDLEHAIRPWDFLAGLNRNNLLDALLFFYRRPRFFALIVLACVIVSFIPWIAATSQILFILAFSLGILGMLITLFQFFIRRGLDFIDLLMPRLLGSIIVGLSILVFESTVWNATLDMQWINWLICCIASYGGALLYFFFDVHKTTRLMPTFSKESSLNSKRSTQSIHHSLQTTWKIFWIGLTESLCTSFLVTVVFAPVILKDRLVVNYPALWQDIPGISTLLLTKTDVFGYAWHVSNMALFIYLPKVVLLWAGLSLLIGAFAQLLWQDQRITSS